MYEKSIAKGAKEALDKINQIQLTQKFYLAGGTSAAIQLGHRISVDLDFFSKNEFEPLDLLRELSLNEINLDNVKSQKGTLQGYFKCNLSYFYYPYELVAKTQRYQNIELANLEDIGAMKITAIADRGVKKDFVDLFFISQELGFETIIQAFIKKFKATDFNHYHYFKSLTYFVDADQSPDPEMLIKWNWGEIKKYFLEKAKTLQALKFKESVK